MELSSEEKALLEQYQLLSAKMPSQLSRIALEIFPPCLFVAVWVFTGKTMYLLVAIVVMVGYNVQRVVRQHKNIVALASIAGKALGNTNETS